MKQKNIVQREGSRVVWEQLEEWVREQVQTFIQGVLKDEVTEFLGRSKLSRQTAEEATTLKGTATGTASHGG